MNQFDVKYLHYRQYNADGTIDPRGGMTIAFVEDENGIIHYAQAACSRKDNFRRSTGRNYARARLFTPHPSYARTQLSEKAFASEMSAAQFEINGLIRKYSRKRKDKTRLFAGFFADFL